MSAGADDVNRSIVTLQRNMFAVKCEIVVKSHVVTSARLSGLA